MFGSPSDILSTAGIVVFGFVVQLQVPNIFDEIPDPAPGDGGADEERASEGGQESVPGVSRESLADSEEPNENAGLIPLRVPPLRYAPLPSPLPGPTLPYITNSEKEISLQG